MYKITLIHDAHPQQYLSKILVAAELTQARFASP
jgi:hypothetical protein